MIESNRVGRARAQSRYVAGQPTRFPRELLPQLIGELEAGAHDPGGEAGEEPRDIAGLDHASRPPIGNSRLINDPSGDPPGATQSENTIAAHGRYLVAGWNESYDPGTPRSFSGFGYSSDGGNIWTDGGTLPHASATDFGVGDPSLTVDNEDNFYYASLYSPDGRVLGVSVNRGRFHGNRFAFGPPVLVASPTKESGLDKEWIAADPDDGTLYVTYTRFFEDGGQQIELVRSKDHGRTWSEPIVLSDPERESCQGSRPAVGPDHEVFVVYASVDFADFSFHVRVRKSTNHGKRFGPAVNVGEGKSDHGVFPNVVTGPPGFNRPGGVELPSIAVDRSRGPGRGDVYVAWPEAVNYFDDALGGAGVVAEVEGNDTTLTATPFPLGVTLTGNLSTDTDADWFSFTGRSGQTVEFFLTPAPDNQTDGFLRLFCRTGERAERLAFSYFGSGQSYIVFTLPSDGTYFIRVTTRKTGSYYIFTGMHTSNPLDVARDSRDVVLARSHDGVHWTRREIVNHDAGRFDNAFPEVAVDGGGDVHLVWYDHRNDETCGVLTDVYASRSPDGGEHFGPDKKVNDGPPTNWNLVPSRLAPNMGDYIGLTADGRSIYANWAEGRLGSPDSWMAVIAGGRRHRAEDDIPVAIDIAPTNDRVDVMPLASLRVASPARIGTPIAVDFDLKQAASARLEIYSVTGRRVRGLVDGTSPGGTRRIAWDTRGGNGEAIAPGVYFVVLRTPDASVTRRLVLLE